jgi:hypothetical protein
MTKKRTYKFPRAEITLTSSSRSGLQRARMLSILADIEQAKSLLKNFTRNSAEARVYGNRIASLRSRLKFHHSGEMIATVKLTDPMYKGYAIDFETEVGENFRLRDWMREKVPQTIRNYRMMNGPDTPSLQFVGDARYFFHGSRKIGRVFSTPGQIFKVHIKKNMAELFSPKKPADDVKYLGIELEFCAKITENELTVKLFRAGLQKIAQLKTDGSLRPQEGETGYELALLLKESSFKKDLKRVIGLLTSIGAVAVDRRAGLHVHLDMRKRNKDTVFSNLVSCQHILHKIVDPSRKGNEFCRMVRSKKFPKRFNGSRQERYKTINAAAYYKYQTIEVRMHEGSVDYAQIAGWTELLIKIANCRTKLTKTISSLTMLKNLLKLNEKVYSYAVDRSCYWQVNNTVVRGRLGSRPTSSGQEIFNAITNVAESLAV